MNLEQFKSYCLSKKGVSEAFPFDEETLVLKVGSKMFALTNINKPILEVNLKCDPFMSQDLRKEYSSIKPGYHMNKTHWNTVTVDGTVPEDKLLFLIDLSYDLVFKSLKKSEKLAVEKR
ncbi:MmcQ/YjbR family DNA-binding protein [Clostridium swellfunianum]|uniref:MmcQ/YjbR family DNA-binding protein n=1 Tax=Clostridium swellfunianum TaxID=1367462 RepID=UPI00202F1333|nr:MmcQ/YjbR family DNA-binding protein [Clostridium swellfunianum]MCM0647351.1 MmcQ/YjbR family DNA-binding protein [Clostridium swellfunianum]